MPTYEFRCPEGHDFEKLYRTISGAESQATCPVCGKTAERRISATGFAFKGSGFYLTDYGKNAHRKDGDGKSAPKSGDSARSESGASDGGSEKAASSSDNASSTAKSESKPEAKSESKADAKVESKLAAPPPPKPNAGE